MKQNEYISELIERYINGTIDKKEKAALEVLAKENQEIAEQIIITKDISKAVKYNGNQELKHVLEKIHDQKEKTEKELWRRPITKWIILIVGLVLCFMLFKKISQPSGNQNTNSALYASNYKFYQASLQNRGKTSSSKEEFNAAYINKEYQKALKIITSSKDSLDGEVLILAGISAFEVEDIKLGLSYFQKVIEHNDYYYKDHAMWYSSLGYLKTGHLEKSKQLLLPLSEDKEADHHTQAKHLLNILKTRK